MAVLLFFIGAILGSFYLVIGTRLPKGEDVLFSRSKCDNCGHVLKWYNLIPLFSYVFQRGKCTFCHKKIAGEHFIVELATGLLFVFTYYIFPSGYYFYGGLIISSLLIIIFVSDFKYFVILDGPLIIFSLLIILFIYLNSDLKAVGFKIMAGLILALFMVIVRLIGNKIFKRDSLGGGDIKLSFLIGLVLGVRLGFVALIISSFIAFPYALYVMNKKEDEMPYGPFLITALIVCFIFQSEFLNLLDLLII